MIATYTVNEAAELLGCEPETVAERIANGDLPAVKFGRGWIIPVQALDQRLNEMALEQAAERRKQKSAATETTQVLGKAACSRKQPRKAPPLPSVGS